MNLLSDEYHYIVPLIPEFMKDKIIALYKVQSIPQPYRYKVLYGKLNDLTIPELDAAIEFDIKRCQAVYARCVEIGMPADFLENRQKTIVMTPIRRSMIKFKNQKIEGGVK